MCHFCPVIFSVISVLTTWVVHFTVKRLTVSFQFRQPAVLLQQLSGLNFNPHLPILSLLLLEGRPAVAADAAAATQWYQGEHAAKGESAAFWQSLQ